MSHSDPHSPLTSTNPKPNRRIIGGLVGLLIMVIIVLATTVGYTLLGQKVTDKAQVITVPSGQNYYGILNQWQQQHEIIGVPIIKAYLKITNPESLKAGAYQLPAKASVKTALQTLEQGKQAQLIKITLIEGQTARQLLKVLEETPNIQHTLAEKSAEQILTRLELPIDHLEGWFAPDTYFFSQGTTDVAILKHLYQVQKRRLDQAWQSRQVELPYKDAYEALIMASLIEKETGISSERAQIAGVFVNRLRRGMRLQTDPTVVYGKADFDGIIYQSDLDHKNPYNTYQIDGLPPTPIAMPSQAAITAATNPDDTNAIFFVATGTGGHEFTTNYRDHQRAVRRYRQYIKNNK